MLPYLSVTVIATIVVTLLIALRIVVALPGSVSFVGVILRTDFTHAVVELPPLSFCVVIVVPRMYIASRGIGLPRALPLLQILFSSVPLAVVCHERP